MENQFVSLKQMAESKVDGVGKATIFLVAPEKIEVEEGFNARPIDRKHLLSIVEAVKNGAPLPPVMVRVKEGRIIMVDGHHRRDAVIYGMQHGILARDQKIACSQYRGDDADCITLLLTSSQGLPLTPLQAGIQYEKLASVHQLSNAQIAARVGKSVQHVADMRVLARGTKEVQKMVEDGKVSANTAVKALRKDAAGAADKLSAEVNKAAAMGKTKATPKTMRRDPAAGNADDRSPREKEREQFETDAVARGFNIARNEAIAQEPWHEYASNPTGHRWAGWLAARGVE